MLKKKKRILHLKLIFTNHLQFRGLNYMVSSSNEISQMQTDLLPEISLLFLTLALIKDIKTIIKDRKPRIRKKAYSTNFHKSNSNFS
jgi:hypothetical protein